MHLPIQHLFSQRSAPEIRIVVAFGERIEIDARPRLRELESPEQVNVLPSDGRNMGLAYKKPTHNYERPKVLDKLITICYG